MTLAQVLARCRGLTPLQVRQVLKGPWRYDELPAADQDLAAGVALSLWLTDLLVGTKVLPFEQALAAVQEFRRSLVDVELALLTPASRPLIQPLRIGDGGRWVGLSTEFLDLRTGQASSGDGDEHDPNVHALLVLEVNLAELWRRQSATPEPVPANGGQPWPPRPPASPTPRPELSSVP